MDACLLFLKIDELNWELEQRKDILRNDFCRPCYVKHAIRQSLGRLCKRRENLRIAVEFIVSTEIESEYLGEE